MNMRLSRFSAFVCFVLVVSAILAPGCANKKPALVAASQPAASTQATPQATPEQPPPPAQETQTQSQGTPPPDPAQKQAQEAQAQEQPTPAEPEKSDKTKAKAKPHPGTRKSGETAHNVPPKIVVRPDGAEPSSTPGQISPSISSKEANQDQATTDQLLQKTENNLNGIKRQLSADEQAIVTQIRDYMNQSRQATKQNDLTRAHNLAVKAQLLCDELVKKR